MLASGRRQRRERGGAGRDRAGSRARTQDGGGRLSRAGRARRAREAEGAELLGATEGTEGN